MFSSVGIQAVSVVVLASVLSPPGGGRGQRKVEDKMTRSGGDDDFVFTFRSTMDPLTEKLYQLMDVTTVDLRSGMAMQFASRQSDDAPGAVGLFAAKLPPNRVTALAKLLTEIRWGQLPEPSGGDINAAQLSIDIRRGKQIVQVGFNAANTGPFMRALGPVIDLVGEIEHDLSGHPLRALNVAVERTPRGLRLSVKSPDMSRCLGAFEDIASIGRNFGVGLGLVSQRPQKINKELLYLAETLFAFRLVGPLERKPIERSGITGGRPIGG